MWGVTVKTCFILNMIRVVNYVFPDVLLATARVGVCSLPLSSSEIFLFIKSHLSFNIY